MGIKNAILVVRASNFNNVKRMFIDRKEINLMIVDKDKDFMDFYSHARNAPLCKIGFEKCNNTQFDKSFYDCMMVPFYERWNSWHIERDHQQENRIIDELNIKEEYIFVHDESSTGKYNLHIGSDLRQIKPTKLSCEQSIFDWIKVIENAKEVHAINSSFVHLINSLTLTNKLFYHDIKASHLMGFTVRGNWQIIKY